MRLFLAWLERGEVTGRLHVRWNTRHGGPGPADDEQRFAVLRRLVHDRTIDPRDRLAGSLLLLYAQPITRTAALRTNAIALAADGQVTITLARGLVLLPEPLAVVAWVRAAGSTYADYAAARRLGVSTSATPGGCPGWAGVSCHKERRACHRSQ